MAAGLCLCHADAEEAVVYMDCSEDLHGYAEAVAQMNAQACAVAMDEAMGSVNGWHAVLYKTNGMDIRSDGLGAACIIAGPNNCGTAFFDSEAMARAAADAMEGMDGVVYAECDVEVRQAGAYAGDVTFVSWAAEQMNYRPYLAHVVRYASGSSTVAVIDSGVYLHPMLADRMPVSGYDYVDADQDVTNDLSGHGTAVAGIIADCTQGTAVYIYPIRVLNASGNGKMSNVVNAVREAIDRGVNVINLSIESKVMSEALDDVIAEAVDAGIAVVVSAGNSGGDTIGVCPAHIADKGVIVVGSVEYDNGKYVRASYSNYGPSVDVYFFGTDIKCCSNKGGYAEWRGTSFAAPHVSAVGAMLYLMEDGISPQEVEERICRASIHSGNMSIPDLWLMLPEEMGFDVETVRLGKGDVLAMPETALPLSAAERITYVSGNEAVVSVEGSELTAVGAGESLITARCRGMEERSFRVIVEAEPSGTLLLPDGLTQLEDEAFRNAEGMDHVKLPESMEFIGNRVFDGCDSLKTIVLPETIMEIGENTFSGAVLICKPDSLALSVAEEKGLPYIIDTGAAIVSD